MGLFRSSWQRGMVLLLLPFLFTRCENDANQNEALVNSTISLSSNAALLGKITINHAYMRLDRLDLHATTPSLDQVHFSTDPPSDDEPLPLLNSNRKPFRINARKNDYDPLSMTISFEKGDLQPVGEIREDGMVDITKYLQDGIFAIYMNGRFDNRGRSMPLHVAIPEATSLRVFGYQYGSPRIRLDMENLAEISINTGYLFSATTTQRLENAEKSINQGQEVIVITPEINSDIYYAFINKLEDTANSMTLKVTVTRSSED